MIKWYIIIIASLWLCFPVITGAGTEPPRPLDDLKGPLKEHAESTYHSGILFSKNDKKKKSDSASADGTVNADEDDDKGETLKRDKNSQKNTKQLKPFVPSETIPADQGVDFPYDI